MNYVEAIKEFDEKKYKSIYIFYGNEKYLFESFFQRLEKIVSKPFFDFDFVVFTGDDYTLDDVMDACEMSPVGSMYRIVSVTGCKFFSKKTVISKELINRVEEYEMRPNPATILVFEASEFDAQSSFSKALDYKKYAVELAKVEKTMLKKWIVKQFRENGKTMDKRALQTFTDSIGYHEKDSNVTLTYIKNEIDTVCSRTLGDTVTIDDFTDLCENAFFSSVFDLVDSMGMRNTEKSVILYNGLIKKGKEPREIFALIVRQFRILKRFKNISENSFDTSHTKTVTDSFRLPPFTHKKYFNQTRYFDEYMIDKIIELCLIADYNSKRRSNDFERELERLIVQLCRIS